MNMLRHIFSFKLVIVFVLLTFLGAVPGPAGAFNRAKCPCPFTLLYKTSLVQANRLGLDNKVDTCFESSDSLRLHHEDDCFTDLGIFDLDEPPTTCVYVLQCPREPDSILGYSYTSDLLPVSPEEVEACRAELKTIAWLSGILPCTGPM